MTDLQDAMHSLQNASDLDLLRLNTAIGHLLRNPARIMAIRRHLHLGQEVDFWNIRDQRLHHGRIIAFKPDQLVVQTESPRLHWTILYAAISIDPSAMPPPPPPERRTTRADFAQQVRDEHAAIVRAIADRDVMAARLAGATHMVNAAERIGRADPAFWARRGRRLADRLRADLGAPRAVDVPAKTARAARARG